MANRLLLAPESRLKSSAAIFKNFERRKAHGNDSFVLCFAQVVASVVVRVHIVGLNIVPKV